MKVYRSDGSKMNFHRIFSILFFSVLACCKFTEATGFRKFARMFPSEGTNDDTTCMDIAKVRDHMESTQGYEKSSNLPTTAQISEQTTPPTTIETDSTDRSSTKPVTEQTKQSTPLKLTEGNTGQLTSTSSTSSSEDLTSEKQTTKQLVTTEAERGLTTNEQISIQLTSTLRTTPPCAPTMVVGLSCDCERTCQDPTTCDCTGPQTCVCPDSFLMNDAICIPEQDCGCYHDEGGLVVPDGGAYVNDDCSERCTCTNNHLSCNSAYTCSPKATCRVEDGARQCYCNDGYAGDGETCKLYTDCYDAYRAGHREDGVYTILPYRWSEAPFMVSCDMTTSAGGWTILQRRPYRSDEFSLSWSEYKTGFSYHSGSHWLGNDKLFFLTNQRNYTLRVDLVDSNNLATYQEYSLFKIANESDQYRLISLGNSSGTAGDGMDGSLGRRFSTWDVDNDGCDGIVCSNWHGDGAWWYSDEWCNECSCNSNDRSCFHVGGNCYKRCSKADLNGWSPNSEASIRIFWNDIYDIASAEMKIRPVNGTVH